MIAIIGAMKVEIDALLDEARTELDSAKRDEIYVQVNQILTE